MIESFACTRKKNPKKYINDTIKKTSGLFVVA